MSPKRQSCVLVFRRMVVFCSKLVIKSYITIVGIFQMSYLTIPDKLKAILGMDRLAYALD